MLSLVSVLLLTGCSNPSSSLPSSSEKIEQKGGYIKEETSINILTMITDTNSTVFSNLIESFKQVEPKVNIHPIYLNGSANYDSLMRSAIAGFFKDDYPDIIQCFPDHVVNYLRFGKVLNMDSFINNAEYGLSQEDKNDYIPVFMEEGRRFEIEGTYSLPFQKSSEIMYYNKKLVLHAPFSQETRNNYPSLPVDVDEEYLSNLTWEDFFHVLAPALKETYSDMNMDCVLSYKSTDNFFITLASEYGGYTSIKDGKGQLQFNNDNMKQWVSDLRQYVQEGILGSEKLSLSAKSSFRKGKSLFAITSNASYASNAPSNIADFDVGVVRIPHAKNGPNRAISQGTPLCFFDHQDDNRALASYLFWKHATSKENSLLWSANSAYMGIRNSNYEIDELPLLEEIAKLNTPSQLRVYNTQWKLYQTIASEMFQTDVFRGSSTCRSKCGELFLKCLNPETDELNIDEEFSKTVEDISK